MKFHDFCSPLDKRFEKCINGPLLQKKNSDAHGSNQQGSGRGGVRVNPAKMKLCLGCPCYYPFPALQFL